MSDYTPATEQVRSHYVFDRTEHWSRERGEQFDRWLADHDRGVRAKALEDAADGLAADPAAKSWELWDSDRREYCTPVDWLRARARAMKATAPTEPHDEREDGS